MINIVFHQVLLRKSLLLKNFHLYLAIARAEILNVLILFYQCVLALLNEA